MKGAHKGLMEELDVLKGRLRQLISQHNDECRRTEKLLREAERSIEDQFARLEALRSTREEISRKFRKAIPESTRQPIC